MIGHERGHERVWLMVTVLVAVLAYDGSVNGVELVQANATAAIRSGPASSSDLRPPPSINVHVHHDGYVLLIHWQGAAW
jgi:hypothetical protein